MPSAFHRSGSVDKDLLLISRISRIPEEKAQNKLNINSLNPSDASDLSVCMCVCQIQLLILT